MYEPIQVARGRCWICSTTYNFSHESFPTACSECKQFINLLVAALPSNMSFAMPFRNSNSREVIEFQRIAQAAGESKEFFRQCSRVQYSINSGEMASLLSELCCSFAKNISSFNNLSPAKQFKMLENSCAPLILILATTPPDDILIGSITDQSAFVKLFPFFRKLNRKFLLHLLATFQEWQPSMEEVACLMAMMLCKVVLGDVEHGFGYFVSQVLTMVKCNINYPRMPKLGAMAQIVCDYIQYFQPVL